MNMYERKRVLTESFYLRSFRQSPTAACVIAPFFLLSTGPASWLLLAASTASSTRCFSAIPFPLLSRDILCSSLVRLLSFHSFCVCWLRTIKRLSCFCLSHSYLFLVFANYRLKLTLFVHNWENDISYREWNPNEGTRRRIHNGVIKSRWHIIEKGDFDCCMRKGRESQ